MSEKIVFAVPREPKIDQIFALFIRMWCVLKEVPNFLETPLRDLLEKHVAIVFRDEGTKLPVGAIPVDWESYNKTRWGSATEQQARECNLVNGDHENIPGLRHLVHLLNDNNQKGTLRRGEGSLVLLLRKAYELDRGSFRSHCGEDFDRSFDTFRLRILCLYWPVVQTYFMACEMCPEEVEEIKNPFTLDGLAAVMETCNCPDLQIDDDMKPFEDLETLVERREAKARERARSLKPYQSFQVPTGGQWETGHHIEVDDRLVATNYLEIHRREVAVLIVRRRDTRQYAVFTTGQQSFQNLFDELHRIEPGRWHLEDRNKAVSPMLLNGSASRDAVPSDLKPTELIELVKNHFVYRRRR